MKRSPADRWHLLRQPVRHRRKRAHPARPRRVASPAERLRAVARELWRPAAPPAPAVPFRSRMCDAARHHLVPVIGYLLATLALTYPLVLHLGTRLPGSFTDGWQNYWNYWWIARALAEGRSPFATPLLYAPDGAPLYLHTLNLFGGIATLPVQWAFGVVAAYNAVVLLSFTLAGYFTYLLVAFVTGDRLAGFVGGLIYAFSSYHLMQLFLEHANLYSSEWLPAFILCLLAADASSGRRRTLLVAAGAVAFVLMLFSDWQYAIFAGLFALLYATYQAVRRRSVTPVVVAAAMGGLGIVLATPVLLPAVQQIGSGRIVTQFEYYPVDFSADLLSFVLPSPFQAWWGGWAARVGGAAVAPSNERTIFLGYLPLALAAIGARSYWARARFWLLAALAFALLALGPYLHVAGRLTFGPGQWQIPLPYLLLGRIPGVNVSRVPARFVLLVLLAVAILAGFGLVALSERLRSRLGARAAAALLVVLAPLLVAEHLVLPVPLKAIDIPPFYRQLATSPESGAILEWPLSLKRSRSLLYQTVHQRSLVGGYLSRPLVYPLLNLPPYREQYYPAADITGGDASAAGGYALHLAGVRWIVILLDDPTLNRGALADFLERYAEPAPLYADARMVVYRPRPPGDATFFVGVTGTGWYERETLDDGQTRMRWFGAAGDLTAWNLTPVPQAGELSFEAWSYAQPRRLEVLLDGQAVGQWLVSARQPYRLPLTLTPGEHTIRLRSLDPPLVPAQVSGGTDTRSIAIGVANVDLQPVR